MSTICNMEGVKHILLTGPPGCGKTTIIIKVCQLLAHMKLPIGGFYTQELRQGSSRVGFDIVTLDKHRGPLARIDSNQQTFSSKRNAPRVGNYLVDLQSFESIALPAISNMVMYSFKSSDNAQCSIMIIDEIGRMELFSKTFENKVKEIFSDSKKIILATVPNKGKPIPFVEELKKSQTAILMEVDFKNRDYLPEKISENIKNTYEKIK